MTERPDIADKVRFWEEQDRINKALIPRVIRINDLFTEHIFGHQDAAAHIGAAEARLAAKISAARMQALGIAGVSLIVAIASVIVSLVL
jgi:hypothetical protein